jgi:hypothetical protein
MFLWLLVLVLRYGGVDAARPSQLPQMAVGVFVVHQQHFEQVRQARWSSRQR